MNKTIITALVLALSLPISARDLPSKEIQFKKGTSSAIVKNKIIGGTPFDHKFNARAGQALHVKLTSNKGTNYFNVIAPDTETAIFIGSLNGKECNLTLPKDGDYIIRTYLMGNAKSTKQTAEYSLDISIKNQTQKTKNFADTLTLQGISFTLSYENEGKE